MKSKRSAPRNIDEYIAGFPPDVQKILQKIRLTIGKAAPQAKEKISYQIPTFFLNGNLVHFAGYKNHVGFYPAPVAMDEFKKELAPYASGRATAQFSLDKPIPYGLIAKIVKFRVKKNLGKSKSTSKSKSKSK